MAKMALIVVTLLGYMPLLMSALSVSLVVPSCSLLMMLFGRSILLLVVVVAAFYGYSLDLVILRLWKVRFISFFSKVHFLKPF